MTVFVVFEDRLLAVTEFSVYVVRAFVRMRELASTHKALEARLEQRLDAHDEAITEILQVIRELMAPPPTPSARPGVGGALQPYPSVAL